MSSCHPVQMQLRAAKTKEDTDQQWTRACRKEAWTGHRLAIAGRDFSVIAGDTRQTEGFNIQTRYAPKVFRL